jgi:cytochrome c
MKRLLLLLVLAACSKPEAPAAPASASAARSAVAGNVENGQALIGRYGCTTCHVVPGAGGPQGSLGPSLAGVGTRPTLGEGAVPNNPENLVRYIQNPASVNPQTSMPTLGINDTEAHDMAAYLLR